MDFVTGSTLAGAFVGAALGYGSSRPRMSMSYVSIMTVLHPKTTVAAFALAGAAAMGGAAWYHDGGKDTIARYMSDRQHADAAKSCVANTPKGNAVSFVMNADGNSVCTYTPQ